MTSTSLADDSWGRRAERLLPKGSQLSPRVWERRHAVIVTVALLQTIGVLCFGIHRGVGALDAAAQASVVGSVALVARFCRAGRAYRSGFATVSLLTASAMLVYQANGATEQRSGTSTSS